MTFFTKYCSVTKNHNTQNLRRTTNQPLTKYRTFRGIRYFNVARKRILLFIFLSVFLVFHVYSVRLTASIWVFEIREFWIYRIPFRQLFTGML